MDIMYAVKKVMRHSRRSLSSSFQQPTTVPEQAGRKHWGMGHWVFGGGKDCKWVLQVLGEVEAMESGMMRSQAKKRLYQDWGQR